MKVLESMLANRPAPKEKAPTQPAEASQKKEGMFH